MSLPLQIQKDSGLPVYVQVEQQLRLLMHQGELLPGDLLPTVRELAVELGVNSNTISRVYRDLQAAGLLVLRRGVGTFVAESAGVRPIRPKDLKGLVKKVDGLVELAQSLGMTSPELSQLIETRWKSNA
ncbi:MAG: GntR family transcriptional regulator [Planctomycetales bacterium]|nr:GntR family transcriptional regulator [Planctomycetales bacterium]